MRAAAFVSALAVLAILAAAGPAFAEEPQAIIIQALDRYDRSAIADLGIDIVEVRDDSVVAIGYDRDIELLYSAGFSFVLSQLPQPEGKGFPAEDSDYHDFTEMVTLLNELEALHPDVFLLYSIGQSLEGRELWTMKISDNPDQDESATEPGLSFVGQHHAREHISREVPLGFLQYMSDTYDYLYSTTNMVETHEIWVTPSLNPDGAEYDIATGSYRWWRKNRRDNAGSSCDGVDPNRNYGYHWGESGSSGDPCSETYRGPSAFSEPETQAYRDFIIANTGIVIIVTYHNYSKLVMWPWGYTYSSIPEPDKTVHQTLGTQYASFTGYTPQQSSSLYTTSGDTCDWAYGDQGRICFCVELDPASQFPHGFYLPDELIPEVNAKNLEGMLYLIWESDDPGKGSVEPLPGGFGNTVYMWTDWLYQSR